MLNSQYGSISDLGASPSDPDGDRTAGKFRAETDNRSWRRFFALSRE